MIKILIAEDDRVSVEFLKEILSESDSKIVEVNNGRDAVDVCTNDPEIDIVLMDIKMPYKDGRVATKEIKAIRPNLPIIAQTAYALDDEKETILKDGFDAYLSKPLRRDDVLSMVSALVKKYT